MPASMSAPPPLPAPPELDALQARMRAAPDAAAAIRAFEGGFHRLPAFASAALCREAADLYDQAGRPAPARLLRGLAWQIAGDPPPAPAADTNLEAQAILEHPHPPTGLLRRLEQLERARAVSDSIALFEAVLPHLPPADEYWVPYRMMRAYAETGRAEMAFLLAGMCLQLRPLALDSLLAARVTAAWLAQRGEAADAAALLLRWRGLHPGQKLLGEAEAAALLARAGDAPPPPPPHGLRERELVPASERAALRLAPPSPLVPHALEWLLQAQARPAITLAELADAQVLIAQGAVSVWAADGTPLPELSVGDPPCLVRRTVEARGPGGADVLAFDQAVLIGDMFPSPNLCHFLLDQASRIALYRGAGFAPEASVVVGPELARPYQTEIARRFGVRGYLGTGGFGRVQVRRLGVLSTCHHVRHTAHWGAAWAIEAVRAAFADVIAAPGPPRRLLVSRADADSRRVVNEAEVEAMLAPFGFERIVPGRMALAEQVRAFAAATHVVAPHGAALANLVFCPLGASVMEMFHPHYGTGSYAVLMPSLGLRYAAMIGRDGSSEDAADNDPALAPDRADGALRRDLRADLHQLRAWIEASLPA